MPDSLLLTISVAGVLAGAWVFVMLSGLVLRRAVRRIADKSLDEPRPGAWRPRVVRGGRESRELSERRRRQRIDAAARGVNQVVAVVTWFAAAIVVFHLLDVDAAFFLSSAGFIGVAIAFGGQRKVSDFLTGLSVLFEDRYGVGDDVEITIVSGNDMRATVEHVGLLTTRLRDGSSTFHVPNSEISVLRNHSQDPGWTRLRVNVDGVGDSDAGDDGDVDDASDEVVRALRRQAGSSQLTDVFFVGDLAAARDGSGAVDVDVQTIKPLDERAKDVLVQRAEETLRRLR